MRRRSRGVSTIAALAAIGLLAPAPALAQQAPRPQDPEPPLPYAAVEVSYANAVDGTRLTGTLTLPPGEGRVPAALLVSGAGAQGRDYEVFGHRPFLVLADHLTRAGVAVLRMDDRGAGGSGGDAADASVAAIVGDLGAGIAFLRAHPRIDASAVGLVAHSEGGRVAPAAALELAGVGYVVLLAPPTLTARDLARVQTVVAMDVSDDPMIPVEAALLARIRDAARDEPDPARTMAAILNGWDEWLATLPPTQAQPLGALRSVDAFLARVEQLVTALSTPWNREIYETDPTPALSRIDVPALALYGSRDLQAPPRWNVAVLQGAWTGHPDATIRVLPGLNHFLQHAETGLASEIQAIEETLAPEALEGVSSWIVERFGG